MIRYTLSEDGVLEIETKFGTKVFREIDWVDPASQNLDYAIIKSKDGKYNFFRHGDMEFEDDKRADVFFVLDGKYVFADLDVDRKIKRKDIILYDEDVDILRSVDFEGLKMGLSPSDWGWGGTPKFARDDFGEFLVDPDGNIVHLSKRPKLQEIYDNPPAFLELETEDFEDKAFVRSATLALKNGIRKDVEKMDVVPDDYVDFVQELTTKAKEKTEKEFAKIEAKSKDKKEKTQKIEKILGDL